MNDWLTTHEPGVRLGAFASVFLLMALWETVAARRELALPKGRRWVANLLLLALDALVLRLVFPAAAVGAAIAATEQGWGLFNLYSLSPFIAVPVSMVLLDLVTYLQHLLFHAVPVLWRLHLVHHADLDFDVTTGLRFHPLEILASMAIKVALVLLVGPPILGVLLFEVLLNATSMFNHGNVRLPAGIDGWLRWVLVTPDMHRVHHSVVPAETNSNFGFNLPWWDRLFGTYRDQPRAGHETMRVGLEAYQERRPQGLLWLLALPFTSRWGAYPLDRRE